MRNKKAENQVKQALEMHPMSEAEPGFNSTLLSHELAATFKPSEHTHTYLVSEYKLVIRNGKYIWKAVEYRCSTCLQTSDVILKPL